MFEAVKLFLSLSFFAYSLMGNVAYASTQLELNAADSSAIVADSSQTLR